MEVNVDGVYFGNSSVYECTTAVFSKLSIKMTFSNSDNGEKKSVLILKKNIFDLKASECCPFPVMCLKVRDKECQKIKEVLKLEEIGVNFNSRSKTAAEAWILIYYNFATFEVPKFLATYYIGKKNILDQKKLYQLINLPAKKKMLRNMVSTLQSERVKRGEPKAEICPESNALMVSLEDRFLAKKITNYVSNVMEGKAVKGREVEVKIEPEAFTARDLKLIMESYKRCLVCATCDVEAILKCKGCMVSRYCSQSCQDDNYSKHKEECSRLLMDRKEKKVQESLVIKELILVICSCLRPNLNNWEKRIPYNVWEKKFTCMVNRNARESMGLKKEINVCVKGVDTLMRTEVD